MRRVRRKLIGCFRRRSVHPSWLTVVILLVLLYHIAYDASKLFPIFFRSNQITINVANYGLSVDESEKAGEEELRKDYDALIEQVNTGQKPSFVLDFGMNLLNIKRILRTRKKSGVFPDYFNGDILLEKIPPSLGYYRSFSELPVFSEVGCRSDLLTRIPNIIHYIWFGKLRMNFLQYLSVRSAASVQKPSKIIIHTDSGEPTGKFWNSLKTEIACLEVEYLPKPVKIFGKYPLQTAQQQSHVSRIKILYQQGGIYANLNVIFLRPFDSLMSQSLVIGREEENYYSNSVILAERGAPFLNLWFQSYNRAIADWSTYSMYIPWRLSSSNPKAQVHVEMYSMMRPGFREDGWVSQRNWVLDKNYCVHLYNSRGRIRSLTKESPLDAIAMDNTFGQLTRMALFGKFYLNDSLAEFRKSVHSSLLCSSSNQLQGSIPNVIHYTLQSNIFTYKHYLSIRSAGRFLMPVKIRIYLLNISEPDNFFWIRMKMEIKCVEVIQLAVQIPKNQDSTKSNLQSFFMGYLWKSGGIFLGFDVIVTGSFTKLLNNSVVMGSSSFSSDNIHAIMFEKQSMFLKEWITWKSNDVSWKFKKYLEDSSQERIEIIPNFPARIENYSNNSLNMEVLPCILLENSELDLNSEEANEYDILRSESLDGKIARTVVLGGM